ncbi:hypothetical protein ACVGVM_26690 [Pseudonocardia bannensis]|uniref:Uncharacterized protein n=1 Tax=Pseudonocardia bannensis TaxID=630973 RepID=A0A848DKY1_9PSEU|nr:hypothetical protein [Pseudonocardia bannensis]
MIAMLFIGPEADEATDEHEGYVAGRYRNGALSDIWTDVARCAQGTFTAFLPACECGWRGASQHPDQRGLDKCRTAWLAEHFTRLALVRHVVAGRELGPRDFLTAGSEPYRDSPAVITPGSAGQAVTEPPWAPVSRRKASTAASTVGKKCAGSMVRMSS